MSKLQEFKIVARTMSDLGMDEPAAAKFAKAYAELAYPRSLDYRKWCLQNIKIFYLEAEQQRKIITGEVIKCERCAAPADFQLKGYIEAKDMAYGLPADKERWEKEGITLHVCKTHIHALSPQFVIEEKIELC